jgi:hypothetical protein
MKAESSHLIWMPAIDFKLATWFGIRNLNSNHQWNWNQVPWNIMVSDATTLENMPMLEWLHGQTWNITLSDVGIVTGHKLMGKAKHYFYDGILSSEYYLELAGWIFVHGPFHTVEGTSIGRQ